MHAPSISPRSNPHSRRALTTPPSWPVISDVASVARARVISLWTPISSSGLRVMPKIEVSISPSQSRNRGQARVQMSQPFSPWEHWSGPSSCSWTGRSSSYPSTWNGHVTMHAVQPVQSPVVTTSWYRSRHWVLSADDGMMRAA